MAPGWVWVNQTGRLFVTHAQNYMFFLKKLIIGKAKV
jgi:hypothetical protein